MVLAIGSETAEWLADYGVNCDMVITDELQSRLPENIRVLHEHKEKSRDQLSGPATSILDTNAPWYDSPFMRAIRLERNDITPIWLMRQAGMYMKEFRDARKQFTFFELCRNSQLCSELACTAVGRLGVDAAIIVSDLLSILAPMGCKLQYDKNGGPVICNPIETVSDIDRIKPLDSINSLENVIETVRQTRGDLPVDIPLIGFSGAPFTLASYMIEGNTSRSYARTKTIMYNDPGAWNQLMECLVQSISICLEAQIHAGAQCVQLFDSWAGCLGYDDYLRCVHPHVSAIIRRVSRQAPVINFATANPALMVLLADTDASVIGIDWRIRLDQAWASVGYDRAVQGNLDPVVLFSDLASIRLQAQHVLNQAEKRAGHIFNLGHSILPQTPADNVIALVDAVHELSQNGHA